MQTSRQIFRTVAAVCAVGICALATLKQSLPLVLAGVFVSFVAFIGLRNLELPAKTLNAGEIFRNLRQNPVMALAIAAGVLTAISIGIVATVYYNLPAVVPWLAAIACIWCAAKLHDNRYPSTNFQSASNSSSNSLRRAHSPSKTDWFEIVSLCLVTVIGLVLRSYDLSNSPPTIHVDEGEMGIYALDILAGKPIPFFWTAPFWGLPMIFNYLQALSIDIFGPNIAGLRMLSVIVGTACIPAVYGIARNGWGKIAGLVAASLLAVSHYQIHYSRIAIICVESELGMIVFALILSKIMINNSRGDVHARGTQSITLFALSGIVLGISQYFYFGSRVMPFIGVLVLAYLYIQKAVTIKQMSIVFATAAIVYAPLATYFATAPDMFTSRVAFVSIFAEQNYKALLGPAASLPADLPRLFIHQLQQILGFFFKLGDAGGFYTPEFAAFDPISVIGMWLGVSFAVVRFRRNFEFMLLAWFALGLIMGGVFTIDAPSGQRLLIVTPVVCIFAGLFVARAQEFFGSLAAGLSTWMVGGAAAILVVFCGYINITTYFISLPKIASGYEAVGAANEFMRYPTEYHNYVMAVPVMYAGHGAIKFVARDAHVLNLVKPDDLKIVAGDTQGTAILAMQNHYDDLHAIERKYPNGTASVVKDPNGRELFTIYRIPAEGAN